ncbi:MAG: acyl-CoA dehydrogenase family protein [Thermoplasmata archaeon]|nr:acyl-CoA dehydrogenase family protein [Thermoplasmata archaeon]
MDFRLTEDQRMVRKMAKDFAEKEMIPFVAEWEEKNEIPMEFYEKMGKLGMLGGPIPEEYGGSGMDYVAYHLMIEEVARACSSVRTTVSVQTSLAETNLLLFGSEELKQKYLVRLAKGEMLGAWALTEPNAGSDVGGMQTIAREEDDGWVLNGSKMFISNGDIAGVVIVFARLPNTKRHDGICAFVVEKGTPGFSIGKVEIGTKLGLRTSHTAELIFEDCKVPKENLIGNPGDGWDMAMEVLDSGRLSVAAGAVGIARACLEASIKYARERYAFGRPIGRFQMIKDKIAQMSTEVDAARLLVLRAAQKRDLGEDNTLEVSQAKLFSAQVVMKAADEAVQIHGGYGYSSEFPVERYFRDAKVCSIYEGTNEIQKLIIAGAVIGELD